MSNTAIAVVRSESYLIGCAVSGDKSAFAALYQKHYEPLVALVAETLLNGNPERASDIAQQAFLDTFRNIREIDRTQTFADSLIEAAFDRTLHGSSQHDKLEMTDAFKQLRQEFLEPEEKDPTKRAESHELAEKRRSALELAVAMNHASNKKYAAGIRYVFDLCNGMSFDDIAAREAKTSARVQKDIARASNVLRDILGELAL